MRLNLLLNLSIQCFNYIKIISLYDIDPSFCLQKSRYLLAYFFDLFIYHLIFFDYADPDIQLYFSMLKSVSCSFIQKYSSLV